MLREGCEAGAKSFFTHHGQRTFWPFLARQHAQFLRFALRSDGPQEPRNEVYKKALEMTAKAPALHAELQKQFAQQQMAMREVRASSSSFELPPQRALRRLWLLRRSERAPR